MRATKRPGYLETINERVVVFDGAFGTYVQDENLTADDFGGQHLEGCNELLAVTRPDLIARMHEDFLKVGVDALETATFEVLAAEIVGGEVFALHIGAKRAVKHDHAFVDGLQIVRSFLRWHRRLKAKTSSVGWS